MLDIVELELQPFGKAQVAAAADLHRPGHPRLDGQTTAMVVLVKPVSYTHLDVYKRQGHAVDDSGGQQLRAVSALVRPGQPGRKRQNIEGKRKRSRSEPCRPTHHYWKSGGSAGGIPCLLYTSGC